MMLRCFATCVLLVSAALVGCGGNTGGIVADPESDEAAKYNTPAGAAEQGAAAAEAAAKKN